MSKQQIWKAMRFAPKTGELITVKIPECEVRVYWDIELKTWVLVSPRHIESISNPKVWRK